MKHFKKLIIAASVVLGVTSNATAQVDPHFSQYYVYPSWLNPGMTGAIDADYRVSAIYRNQWAGITNAFSTVGLSADFVTDKNLNFGVSLLNQTAGDGGYTYTTAYGNIAYTGLRLGVAGTHRIVFGVQGGLINRRFNPSKFTFGDQWNPATGFPPSNPTSTEVFARTSAATFDAGAGVAYYDATPGKKANMFLGFSASHLTQPEDPFISTGTPQKLPMRLTFHGGVRLLVSETFSITPNLLYLRQGNAEEKMVGAYGQIRANEQTDFMFGANYRFNDAISPYIGFSFKSFVLGASYDVNTSDLGRAAGGGANSFEISLSFFGRKNKTLPAEPFVCPRL
jgi:type IX secretion system PorP/SprF family membrane protein